ncbi:NADH dehydrogenase i chain m, membrane subunit [Luminiphilus syltensis NOR5-1B]|uniref:NADH-quinone oxidoreductase subunit M n=1 Tax=Luminiphilus syltensis NOR5-1B TaxID=565045 RepID=B8KTG9_9GAMM|nr:NADH-quinone oxidoreductase subunit M [Luminiphilus syltensis]EED36096.1 NADH dehydrogenase i chain m, membrane subunit [Luminiphilus syltensis NOR5-1B]
MSLSLLIFLPLLGGVAAWLAERVNPDLPRWISLLTCLLVLLVLTSSGLSALADPASSQWLLYSQTDWIPRFGISFELALDGFSLLLLVLTFVLGLIAVAASWSEVEERHGFFQANLLWTLAGVAGVFLAMDLILFFLFWEVMLVPMYLLIAIWGHENRGYAAMKFFIFTQVSGLLMLLAIVVLAWQGAALTGKLSFSYGDLLGLDLPPELAFWLMLGFFLAFTVKLPGFPFHTWLPDAHTQAPTAGSVLLAGILLKTGAYGLLRFTVPLFPEASQTLAPVAMLLGVAGIIYGALLAFAQTDFKRLVAYSSVSHMGFILLGVYAFNELALQGAVMQMVTHGVSTAALFMMAGALQHRLHTRDMRKMGGLWQQAPRMGACAMFFVLASLGLPGLGNFVAEFLVLLGLFAVAPWMTAAAAVGMVTAAIYALWLMQSAFQGQPDDDRQMADFGVREMTTMAVMMVALLWMGLYPQPILDLAAPAVQSVSNLLPANTLVAGVAP